MDSKPTVAGGNSEGLTNSMNLGFGPNMFPGFNMPSLMGMHSGLNPASANGSLGGGTGSSFPMQAGDFMMMPIRQQFEAQVNGLKRVLEDATKAGRQANIDRDAALLKAEQASTETSSVKAELPTLRMSIDASKLESQHPAETLALTITQMEHANKEAASAQAELKGLRAELETCKVDSHQQATKSASVTSRVESADKSAASARAEAETLRTHMDAYKQVHQQQNGAIQMMTEDAKRHGIELLRTQSSLETIKLDIAQKIAIIEQLTTDRDAERAAVRQEREQREYALQGLGEEVRGARDRLKRAEDAYRNSQQELDQYKDQLNQVKSYVERAKSNPFRPLGW